MGHTSTQKSVLLGAHELGPARGGKRGGRGTRFGLLGETVGMAQALEGASRFRNYFLTPRTTSRRSRMAPGIEEGGFCSPDGLGRGANVVTRDQIRLKAETSPSAFSAKGL